MNGTSSFTSPGVTSETGSIPQAFAEAMRRRQLLHPLLRPRDLDAARLGEDAHLLVLAHALERELRHLLRVVDREDEVRGVSGRAARVRQRALVEQDDVRPALVGEVVGDRVADDAAADDDGAGLAGRVAHRLLIYQKYTRLRGRGGSRSRSRRRAGASPPPRARRRRRGSRGGAPDAPGSRPPAARPGRARGTRSAA